MSKRHQSSRRKTYGRRQHELRERVERQHFQGSEDGGQEMFDLVPERDISFFDLDMSRGRLRFALGD